MAQKAKYRRKQRFLTWWAAESAAKTAGLRKKVAVKCGNCGYWHIRSTGNPFATWCGWDNPKDWAEPGEIR